MKNDSNLVNKTLVCGIIVLFIGVSVAPGITAVDLKALAISQTKTPNLSGIKAAEEPSLKISSGELTELERFFNGVLERLYEIRTLADVIAIYNEVITFLDEYNLLPEGISVEELQQLVNSGEPSPELLRLIREFYLEHLEEIKGENVVSSDGTVVLSCDFYTLDGIERVEKAVAVEDAEHISELMDDSDYGAVVSELSRLGLLPQSMSVGEAEDLISGEYGIRQFEEHREQMKGFPFQPSGTKYNLFSIVSGSGDSYEVTSLRAKLYVYSIFTVGILLLTIDVFLVDFPWYPIWITFELIPGDELKMGPLGVLAFLMAMLCDFILCCSYGLNPIKLGLLFDGHISGSEANLNTLGLLGKWQMESSAIYLSMTGFLGLLTHSSKGFKLSGFCFYIEASDHNGGNNNLEGLPVVSPCNSMYNTFRNSQMQSSSQQSKSSTFLFFKS